MSENTLEYSCETCDGTGQISDCCGVPHYKGKRCDCNRTCYWNECAECFGKGKFDLRINQELDLITTVFTPEYLKKWKKFNREVPGDRKVFTGRIVSFPTNTTVLMKFPMYKTLIKVNIEDLEI